MPEHGRGRERQLCSLHTLAALRAGGVVKLALLDGKVPFIGNDFHRFDELVNSRDWQHENRLGDTLQQSIDASEIRSLVLIDCPAVLACP